MRLPSGREIAYPFPCLRINDRGQWVVVFMDNFKGQWVECRHGQGGYGGTWIENAVQAVARDLFAAAMLRLEAAGYPIVLHVHDEICAEVPKGFGSAEEFLQILTTPPSWADGLPIAAKVRGGKAVLQDYAEGGGAAPRKRPPHKRSHCAISFGGFAGTVLQDHAEGGGGSGRECRCGISRA